MSWLPLPPTPPTEKLRPWLAPSLEGKVVVVTTLTYIVVEEIVGSTVGLSLSPWPAADQKGRLRFALEGDPVHVAVEMTTLCDFLGEHHLSFVPPGHAPGQEEARPLVIGTALAASVRRTDATVWTRPLRRWIPGSVYDITADAREVAKLAHYGAVTDEWTQERAQRYGLTGSSEEETPW